MKNEEMQTTFRHLGSIFESLKFEELTQLMLALEKGEGNESVLGRLGEISAEFEKYKQSDFKVKNQEEIKLKVELYGLYLPPSKIISFGKNQRYDFRQNKMLYTLVLNPSTSTNTTNQQMYLDYELVAFGSKEELEKEWLALKGKLRLLNIIFY
jgi:hypothetical protein